MGKCGLASHRNATFLSAIADHVLTGNARTIRCALPVRMDVADCYSLNFRPGEVSIASLDPHGESRRR